MDITLADLERAINYWRTQKPSTGEERRLSTEVNVLAHLYAMMIFNRSISVSGEKIDAHAAELISLWRNQQSR